MKITPADKSGVRKKLNTDQSVGRSKTNRFPKKSIARRTKVKRTVVRKQGGKVNILLYLITLIALTFLLEDSC